jgi:hypothetical protein
MIEMSLVGVVATQLWHHTFVSGDLADLPTWKPEVRSVKPEKGIDLGVRMLKTG